jgi:hypothetical protein
VGEATPANTFLAIWMAQAAGFYEAQGLQLEIIHMVGGSESGPSSRAVASTSSLSACRQWCARIRRARGSQFAPVHETSGGRRVAERAHERIMTDADFAAQQLPAVDEWMRRRAAVQP